MKEENIKVGSEVYIKESVLPDSDHCIVIKSIKYKNKARPTRYYPEGSERYTPEYFKANELVPISCKDLPKCSECPF